MTDKSKEASLLAGSDEVIKDILAIRELCRVMDKHAAAIGAETTVISNTLNSIHAFVERAASLAGKELQEPEQITIGQYRLRREPNGISITAAGGEGGVFDEDSLKEAIGAFYNDNF